MLHIAGLSHEPGPKNHGITFLWLPYPNCVKYLCKLSSSLDSRAEEEGIVCFVKGGPFSRIPGCVISAPVPPNLAPSTWFIQCAWYLQALIMLPMCGGVIFCSEAKLTPCNYCEKLAESLCSFSWAQRGGRGRALRKSRCQGLWNFPQFPLCEIANSIWRAWSLLLWEPIQPKILDPHLGLVSRHCREVE